uniref:Protein TIFY n=1 Tax=Tanacetum cinerariifolium TaxID=118510 RepID=A0A6L2N1R8_TANCI|nr:protein TIFY 5A [Tanacetum cinerariifolium]
MEAANEWEVMHLSADAIISGVKTRGYGGANGCGGCGVVFEISEEEIKMKVRTSKPVGYDDNDDDDHGDELRLVPPPAPLIFSAQQHRRDDARQENPSDEINAVGGDLNEKQSQQLTIFYDGKVSVCDVTELQARSIIKLANEEIEEKRRRSTPGSTTSTELSSPLISPPVYTPRGISMKRSLQRFLQKRKRRIEATSPYHH